MSDLDQPTRARHIGAMIYKIFRPDEWDALQEAGETAGAPIDVSDGYIHFSTAKQVRETAEKHFADAGDLILVGCDPASLGPDLKWEPSRGGALFPHLYRTLTTADVVAVWNLPRDGDGHRFPDSVS